MASKQKHVFARNRPLINIYSGLDHEGKEVEVREDAEQQVKYHEIVEALAAAGYHRAHMQTISAFDKMVGGMTWCIELCDIDVDVSLLFEENLTIGKKIALTEKIVAVLPSIRCPYTIEPHQIQGLDFINLYPLIVWLIKHSDEYREEKEEELRRFAVMQYDKANIFEMDRERFRRQRQFLKNLANVQNAYKPCRVRKRTGALPQSQLEQVNSVLAEYDQRALLHVTADADSKDDGLEFLRDIEKDLADPSKNTTEMSIFNSIESGDESEKKLHYDILHSELTGDVSRVIEEKEKDKYIEEIAKLKEQKESVEKELNNLRENHDRDLEEAKSILLNKKKELQKFKELFVGSQGQTLSNKEIKEMYTTLKSFCKEREQLQRVIDQKCTEHAQLLQTLQSLRDGEKMEEEPLTAEERRQLDEKEERMRVALASMRRVVGERSRSGLALCVAVDERPDAAELLQYERRFRELLQQVAAKHKETKQFYTLHNTLYEVKLYTTKELSLLNSILEKYDEAMSSSKKRDQFMTQLETIVEWVKSTVIKVELKYREEKDKKLSLSNEYAQLLELRRQYDATLKKLAAERRKLRELS